MLDELYWAARAREFLSELSSSYPKSLFSFLSSTVSSKASIVKLYSLTQVSFLISHNLYWNHFVLDKIELKILF